MLGTESTTESTIKFSPDIEAQQDNGEKVFLAAIFYKPETDELEYYFSGNMPEEESIAVLRKFRVYPSA
jgi:hypothetical protein